MHNASTALDSEAQIRSKYYFLRLDKEVHLTAYVVHILIALFSSERNKQYVLEVLFASPNYPMTLFELGANYASSAV